MEMIDDVLLEFRGQLSLSDIYHMTYKELNYLRRHRRQRLSDKKFMESEAIQTMAGL